MKIKPTAEDRELLGQLRQELKRQFQRAGRGARTKVLTSLGVSQSSLDMAFSRGSVKVVFILQMLRELGVEPGRFFFLAIPPKNTLPEPEGTPPLAVRIGMERMSKESWFDEE